MCQRFQRVYCNVCVSRSRTASSSPVRTRFVFCRGVAQSAHGPGSTLAEGVNREVAMFRGRCVVGRLAWALATCDVISADRAECERRNKIIGTPYCGPFQKYGIEASWPRSRLSSMYLTNLSRCPVCGHAKLASPQNRGPTYASCKRQGERSPDCGDGRRVRHTHWPGSQRRI